MYTSERNSGWYSTGVLAVVIALVLAAAVPAAAAQSGQPAWADEMYADFDAMLPEYNEKISSGSSGSLEIAKSYIGGERVNFVVTDSDGQTATFSFHMDEDLRLTEFEQGPRDDATLRMSTDRATVEEIMQSSSPDSAFYNAVLGGEIEMDGLGVISAIKTIGISILLGAANQLGLF